MPVTRGVIAAPGVIRPLPSGFTLERTLSVEELRYYTLYWDQVLIPGNNLVYVSIPDEEQWIAAGAISRPRVAFQGSFKGDQITHALLSCQNLVAAEVRQKAPLTDWVMHQVGRQHRCPRRHSDQQAGYPRSPCAGLASANRAGTDLRPLGVVMA